MNCGDYNLDEASLSRAYQHVVDKKSDSYGMLTAYRSANSKKENKKLNKDLENDLRKMGYGFFKVEGHWRECQDKKVKYKNCPEEQLIDANEESFFVPNIKKDEIESLRKKYDQDSVIYGDKDHEAHLMYRDGSTENIGKFNVNKINQAYSRMKGNRTFIFAKPGDKVTELPKDEPKKDVFGKDVKKPDINKLKSLLPKDVLNKTVKNPATGNTIKVKSALSYDKKSPVFQAAKQIITKK